MICTYCRADRVGNNPGMKTYRIWDGRRSLSVAALWVLAISAVAGLVAPVVGGGDSSRAEVEPVDYNVSIRPILSSHCFACHGPDEGSRQARLRLDVRDDAVRERLGIQAIVPGDPNNSEIVARIKSTDPREVMPPPKHGAPLSGDEIELLQRWIAQGAPYAEHWAWTGPRQEELPEVSQPDWARNEIDHFILARLDKEGLRPSAPADRHDLIRRVTMDLTGLPPTVEEVREFVEDDAPDAYERLVDRLLDSPSYGERWARVWLDLARYADSAGYGSDPLRPNLWPWRDWVIEALNRNLSYDRFTIEQLAGDLLPEATQEQLIATAFHRNTMTNTEGGTDDEEYRIEAVKDRANTTGQVWMGLTVGCAECHSHKFDPISHSDYYRFFAFFNQTEDNDQPDERPTLPLPNAEQSAEMNRLQARIEELETQYKTITPLIETELAAWETGQAKGMAWKPLDPVRVSSIQSSSFERLPDRSVLAVGPVPETDTYLVEARTELARVTGLRLELLPHVSLPSGGPGRALDSGRVVLTEVEVAVRSPAQQPPRARFVRIELPGPHRVLSLAEVEVYEGSTNLALSGAATQSSTADGAGPYRAIDGRTTGDFDDGSTTMTLAEDNPWWELDLGAEHPLETLVLWNRTDGGLGTRLTGFKVRALDADRDPVWERQVDAAPSPVRHFRLPPETTLKLREASADHARPEFAVSRAIDGNLGSRNGWGVEGGRGEVHAAAFEIEGEPILDPGSIFLITLTQRHGDRHALGRFRLSLTDEPPPVRELPRAIRSILKLPDHERTENQRVELVAYFRQFAPSLEGVRSELSEQRRALAAIRPVAIPIMKEVTADQRRVTHILNQGNFLDPGDAVEAGVPEGFHAWPEGAPTNRLGLATWLVSRDNPLTARVAVNRWWGQLFGAGLVETEEDFGTQGALPTHPELLDWLALEFMNRDWDMKAMLKLMVTSATYQQSARVTPDLLEADPRNRLYARGPRQRLEAEMIRDQALALSGLLSPKQGGPSVFPPQPDGLWRAAFNDQRTWTTSEGEDRYRRGLYTFWRRTVPYPSLATFDAPSREGCTVRRLPTNTPLQALVTLNDPVYVEAAQALGRRLVNEGGATVAERVRFGLELCLARPATPESIRIVVELYERELAHYTDRPEDALRLATDPLGPLPEGLDAAEAAAWTSVANALLNLDAILIRG
jgi:mono/diheme cytochrome c family protein